MPASTLMRSGQSTDATDRVTRKDSWFLSRPVRLWSAFSPPVAVLSPALSVRGPLSVRLSLFYLRLCPPVVRLLSACRCSFSGSVRLWSAFCPPVAVPSPALSVPSAFCPPVQGHELRQLARLEIRHDPVVDVARPPVHHVIAARTRGRLVLVRPLLRPRVHVDQVLSPPVHHRGDDAAIDVVEPAAD